METQQIEYRTKTADETDILAHLRECAGNYVPRLDERVNLGEYSRKLYTKSMTFEAWEKHCLVGLIAAYFNSDSASLAYITNVSVSANYMGAGIASRLLSGCIEYARKEGFEAIELEVGKENNRAIALYKRFGFMTEGVENKFLKMRLPILK
jgi:ribosomal protein S18 acetylase RimI-like enzyme